MTPTGMDTAGAALVVVLGTLAELAQVRSGRPVVLWLVLSLLLAPLAAVVVAAAPHAWGWWRRCGWRLEIHRAG